MDDEVHVIEQHPLSVGLALDVLRLETELLGEVFLHGLGDGENLPVRVAVADDEVIREVAPAAKIENDDVLRLFVACRLDAVNELWSQCSTSFE